LAAISLRALIDTSLTFGTFDEVTLKILVRILSTYLSPKWLNAIYFREYNAAILK